MPSSRRPWPSWAFSSCTRSAFGAFISFTNYPLVGPYHFIGGANYRALLHNPVFIHSIVFTLEYTAIVTVPILVVGYLLAVFTRSNRFGSTLFRTCFFLPFIVGISTLSFLIEVELQPGLRHYQRHPFQAPHRRGQYALDSQDRPGPDRHLRPGRLVRLRVHDDAA